MRRHETRPKQVEELVTVYSCDRCGRAGEAFHRGSGHGSEPEGWTDCSVRSYDENGNGVYTTTDLCPDCWATVVNK